MEAPHTQIWEMRLITPPANKRWGQIVGLGHRCRKVISVTSRSSSWRMSLRRYSKHSSLVTIDCVVEEDDLDYNVCSTRTKKKYDQITKFVLHVLFDLVRSEQPAFSVCELPSNHVR